MAINIKKLEERIAKFTFTYGDQSMEVEYKPGLLNSRSFIQDLVTIDDTDEILLHWLSGITKWELVDGDNQPLPLTMETVKSVERLFLVSLVNAIRADIERRTEEKKV